MSSKLSLKIRPENTDAAVLVQVDSSGEVALLMETTKKRLKKVLGLNLEPEVYRLQRPDLMLLAPDDKVADYHLKDEDELLLVKMVAPDSEQGRTLLYQASVVCDVLGMHGASWKSRHRVAFFEKVNPNEPVPEAGQKGDLLTPKGVRAFLDFVAMETGEYEVLNWLHQDKFADFLERVKQRGGERRGPVSAFDAKITDVLLLDHLVSDWLPHGLVCPLRWNGRRTNGSRTLWRYNCVDEYHFGEVWVKDRDITDPDQKKKLKEFKEEEKRKMEEAQKEREVKEAEEYLAVLDEHQEEDDEDDEGEEGSGTSQHFIALKVALDKQRVPAGMDLKVWLNVQSLKVKQLWRKSEILANQEMIPYGVPHFSARTSLLYYAFPNLANVQDPGLQSWLSQVDRQRLQEVSDAILPVARLGRAAGQAVQFVSWTEVQRKHRLRGSWPANEKAAASRCQPDLRRATLIRLDPSSYAEAVRVITEAGWTRSMGLLLRGLMRIPYAVLGTCMYNRDESTLLCCFKEAVPITTEDLVALAGAAGHCFSRPKAIHDWNKEMDRTSKHTYAFWGGNTVSRILTGDLLPHPFPVAPPQCGDQAEQQEHEEEGDMEIEPQDF